MPVPRHPLLQSAALPALVEVIPGPEADGAVMNELSDFCDVRLGKGVVRCKDTPNFIANRIGSFYGSTVTMTMEGDYTIEEVDALTGPLIGVPKSARFRSARHRRTRRLGVRGTETCMMLCRMTPGGNDFCRRRSCTDDRKGLDRRKDRARDSINASDRKKKSTHIDWKTLEYHPRAKVRLHPWTRARSDSHFAERMRKLGRRQGPRWVIPVERCSRLCFCIRRRRIPEISDRIVEIDRAMRWGYGHK